MERALEQLLSASERLIAELDASDGDSDLEEQCEDEGAAREGEGDFDERKPDLDEVCSWPDEGPGTEYRPIDSLFAQHADTSRPGHAQNQLQSN